jgi:AraC-like DNA-binding protein
VEGAVFGTDDDRVRVAHAARVLTAALPAPDPVVDEVVGIVARIAADPSVRRVNRLAATLGVGPRTLQRLFHEYVGVGPKWVIRQYRLHDAAGRIAAGEIEWAQLAAELGYSDQAHLVRDFTAAVGVPPARYADNGGRASQAAGLSAILDDRGAESAP